MKANLRPRKKFFNLLAFILFDHVSLNMTFPILTLIFFDMHTRLFTADVAESVRSLWYGVCIAIPHVMVLITAPLLSSLSDYYGRKPLLLIGGLSALLFSVIGGMGILLGSLSLLLIARVIQGLFSRTNPIAQAVVGDVSDAKHKVTHMAYLQFVISIGAFVGPILGGYCVQTPYFSMLNFSLPFFVAAFIAAIGFLVTAFLFQETLPAPTTRLAIFSFKTLLKQPRVIHVSILLFLCQVTWSLYYQFIPPILKTYFHFHAQTIGLFVGLVAFWLALATAFGVQFLRRFFNLQKMLFYSVVMVLFGIMLSIVVCMLHLATLYLWMAAIPVAAGDVIAYSCLTALYSNAVSAHEQGKVMGLCFIIVSLVWAATGLLGGFLSGFSVLLPLIVSPIGVVLLLLFMSRQQSNTD